MDGIAEAYDIDYRRTLAEVIADNTEILVGDLPSNVFLVDPGAPDGSEEPPSKNER